MRQDQRFPAQVELLLYDKPVRLWRLISENETKCSNFEQNGSTKSPKATGVQIVPECGPTHSRLRHAVLIRSAPEMPDTDVLNGGSNAEIQHVRADLVSFEGARFSIIRPATSNVMRSAPKCRISKLDPSLDVQRSGLFSKLRISEVEHS